MIIGFAIDHIAGLGAVDFPAVLRYILILAGCYLVSAVLTWLCAVLANNIAYRTANALRIRCFQRILHLPLGVIDRHPHGDYISRLSNDADAVADGLNQLLVQFFSGIITCLLYTSRVISSSIPAVLILTIPAGAGFCVRASVSSAAERPGAAPVSAPAARSAFSVVSDSCATGTGRE